MNETPLPGAQEAAVTPAPETAVQAAEQSDLERSTQRQVESRIAALEPAVQPGETSQAAIERHRAAQVDAARQTINAIAQGDTVGADNAHFNQLAAEAQANVLSGSPDDLLTESPTLTQAAAQAMVEQQQAEAPLPAEQPATPAVVAETPPRAPAEPLAPVVDIGQYRARPATLEDHIRRAASNG
jgi:hypothetical protein